MQRKVDFNYAKWYNPSMFNLYRRIIPMLPERNCEYCHKEFKPRDKIQVGRFCSSLCNRKVLRKKQLEDHQIYLSNETEDQKLQWLKEHYEKFVIKRNDDCWDWSGSKVHGYANFNHRGKIMKAHRASWIVHNGLIPSGMFVLHKCDVRHCTRPDHLFLGDHTDNMRDMACKKRTGVSLGEKNKASVLKMAQVIRIKELLNMGVSAMRISKDFKVNVNTIRSIKYGITWKCAA